jgi:hypothetical protein
MPFFFGDGFDPYAAPADAYAGGTYWDTGTATAFILGAGRFSGGRGLTWNTAGLWLQKSSGQNDSVHHFNIAYQQASALTGTSALFYILLADGATNQCAVVFRQDGAILLTSGGPTGTTLATYTGAVTAINTWFGFEFEVVVHNSTGSFAVRKLGNPGNDFSLGGLDTAGGTANNYANRATLGCQVGAAVFSIDDFLWRSDTASVPWAGELRCYTRMPASDASVQWTPSGAVVPMAAFPANGTINTASLTTTTAQYIPFVASCTGTVTTLSMQCAVTGTANFKCSIYASAAGVPTTVLGSANVVANPAIGTVTWTFPTPVAVVQGTTYYAAFHGDAAGHTWSQQSSPAPPGFLPLANTVTYAAFPGANPGTLTAGTNFLVTINITPTAAVNAPFVADAQQDAAATYVSSTTVGQTDLYTVAAISGTPTGIVGVTTRALAQKSDAGTRNLALRLRSGATDVTGTSTALGTTFGWVWRSDTVDPATGAAWTPTGVNNLLVGGTVSA